MWLERPRESRAVPIPFTLFDYGLVSRTNIHPCFTSICIVIRMPRGGLRNHHKVIAYLEFRGVVLDVTSGRNKKNKTAIALNNLTK
jgi:hypothetical protein